MDNANTCDIVLEKKLDDYSANKKDFLAAQELTVTITLREYRDLVTNCATREADISKANNEKWKYQSECEELKKKISELKEKLYERSLEQEKGGTEDDL